MQSDLFVLHSTREVEAFTALARRRGLSQRFALARLPFAASTPPSASRRGGRDRSRLRVAGDRPARARRPHEGRAPARRGRPRRPGQARGGEGARLSRRAPDARAASQLSRPSPPARAAAAEPRRVDGVDVARTGHRRGAGHRQLHRCDRGGRARHPGHRAGLVRCRRQAHQPRVRRQRAFRLGG